jgi:hypothetical protein
MDMPYTKIVEYSGVVVKLHARIVSSSSDAHIPIRAGDGYVTLMQEDYTQDGVYFPAKSLSLYLRNSESARSFAEELLKLAEEMEKVE